MSNKAVPSEPTAPSPPITPPVTAPPLWERLTAKQIAGGTLMVALALMGLWLLVMLRDVLMLLFLGIVIGTALNPLVERLRGLGLRRDWSMLLAFSVMIAILVGIIIALVPFFISQATLAYGQFPSGYRSLYDSLTHSSSRLMRFVAERLPPDPFGAMPVADDTAIADQISDMLPSATNTALASVFVLLLAYYWVYYRQHAVQAVILLFPTKWRDDVLLFWREAEEKIGAFVRGLVLLSLAMGVLSGIGFSLIGLPNAFTVAIVAGLLEAIPYVGPLILMLVAALVGLSVSPQLALMAVLVAAILQFLEGNLLVPRVMDHEVGVHPVITLLAIGIFADVFGLLGALLAVPLAAIIQLLFDRWLLKAPSAEQLTISGRGRAALVRYHIQTLANDLRQRTRAREQEGDDANAPARLEAWLVRLDATLAEKELDS